MPKTIQGTHLRQLRSLKPIFEHWIRTVNKCVDSWAADGDLPWWYGERASLSLFAGAIWQSNGLVFEEYASSKRAPTRKAYRVRSDLYFEFGGSSFIAEAKPAWSRSKPGRFDPSAHLQDRLNLACRDIRRCIGGQGRRLGIVFTDIAIPRRYADQVESLIDRWISAIKTVDYSACAWVFPKLTRDIGKLSISAGGAVFVREVR